MKVSTILHRSSVIYSNSPLFIFKKSRNNADATKPPGSTVTYKSAWNIACQHKRWIEDQVERFIIQQQQQQKQQRRIDNEQDDVNSITNKIRNVEVVVAYLSGNSPDLLLSLFGCIDVSMKLYLTLKHRKKSDTENCNKSQKASDLSMKELEISVIPVMLNARWTSNEIVNALKIPENDDDDNSGAGEVLQITLILYSKDKEVVAQEAISSITQQQYQQNRTKKMHKFPYSYQHHALALPLPSFSPSSSFSPMHLKKSASTAMRTIQSNDNQIESFNIETDTNSDIDIKRDGIILFTSGTSSVSSTAKGVRLPHLSLLIQSMTKMSHPCSYDSNTIILAPTVPFFHVGGLSSALALIMSGGSLLFLDSFGIGGGFNPIDVLQSITTDGYSGGYVPKSRSDVKMNVNTLVLVPTMVHSIIQEIEKVQCHNSRNSTINRSYPGVKLILVGGQSLTQPQLNSCRRYFPNSRIVQTYACTEAGSSITFAEISTGRPDFDSDSCSNFGVNRGTNASIACDENYNHIRKQVQKSKGTLAGVPPPHVELAIFQTNTTGEKINDISVEYAATKANTTAAAPVVKGADIFSPPHQIGIIATRGPHVMNGYWYRGKGQKRRDRRTIRNFDSSSASLSGIDPNGWLRTNDLGYVDENGRLFFCGRVNDIIRTGGESVFAPEVEAVLVRHPFVDSCAVIGMVDDKFGEVVCAAIVMVGHGRGEEIDEWYFDGSFDLRKQFRVGLESQKAMKDLRMFCGAHGLSGYKRPRRVFLLNDLPRNSSGKVLKHEVKRICKLISHGFDVTKTTRRNILLHSKL